MDYHLTIWCRIVLMANLLLSSLSQALHADNLFTDSRQGTLVTQLSSYEISHPYRVDSRGQWLSNSSQHRLTPDSITRRRRRSLSRDDMASFNDDVTDDIIHYQMAIENQVIQLNLAYNNRLFAPGLIVERRRGNNITNSQFRTLEDSGCHFVGKVEGIETSTAAISTCYGLHGFIRINNTEYFIEPVKGLQDQQQQHSSRHKREVGLDAQPHLIYRRTSLPLSLRQNTEHHIRTRSTENSAEKNEKEEQDFCSTKGDKLRELYESEGDGEERENFGDGESGYRRRRRKRSVSKDQYVETLVVVDHKMIEYYKDEDLQTYLLTIMNMVADIFHDASIGNAINIALVRIIYLEKEEKDLEISIHAENTLTSFCKWQKSINPKGDHHANHHDVAILLTRYDLCGRSNEPCSTLGLSQVSGLCQPLRSCNINEDTGLSLAFTVAHELGHNFGMQHDTVEGGCERGEENEGPQNIMSATLRAGPRSLVWSNCSRRAITVFLDRDWGYCLNDTPAEHPFKFKVLPPGVMYSIDHQCRLQYGPKSGYCHGMDDLCTTIWCRVGNSCHSRGEAAAEGTLCGENKWCFGGRCVDIGEKPEAIDSHWGEWSEWRGCSRTCGAGVAYSERLCNNPPPSHGGRYCIGERRRYRICNTEDCPHGSPTFREHQCSEFNHIPHKGQYYQWEPVATPETPCQLHCKPKGKMFSVMLKDIITDGTKCRTGRRDMCISGRCRPVGCDWVIQSGAREDNCGVCHGDGSTCETVKTKFEIENGLGYVEANIIPAGARNIRVEEVAEARNYLAIRNDKGQYYLNGDWYIQWSGDYEAAGTVFQYRRDGYRETLVAQGPTREPLHVMAHNPGVRFEYTLPHENASHTRPLEFNWKFLDWTHCTSSCGGGTQISEVVCIEKEGSIVDDIYCNDTIKYDNMIKKCNEHQCPAKWWHGPWQHCSVTCGEGGHRRRTVLCVRHLGQDEHVALENWECEGLEKPLDHSPCPESEVCPSDDPYWQTGPWSMTCTDDPCIGQNRSVTCSHEDQGCDLDTKPATERPCPQSADCGTWSSGNFSQCSRTCGGGLQWRNVTCVGGLRCRRDQEPPEISECNIEDCPLPTTHHPTSNTPSQSQLPSMYTTESLVQDTTLNASDTEENHTDAITPANSKLFTTSAPEQWTSATTEVKMTLNNSNEENVEWNSITNTTNNSVVTTKKDASSYLWMALEWGECSKNCNGGTRKRSAMCLAMTSGTVVDDVMCDVRQKPQVEEECGKEPCVDWSFSDWLPCSSVCGEGISRRDVICTHPFLHCDPDTKPEDKKICNSKPCADWSITDDVTEQCSQTCGGGSRKRKIECVDKVTGQALDLDLCPSANKPSEYITCNDQPCPQVLDIPLQLRQRSAEHRKDTKRQCLKDEFSVEMCKALRSINKCEQNYVKKKCCKTCFLNVKDLQT